MLLKRMRELLDRNLALLLKNTLLNKQNLLTRFHLAHYTQLLSAEHREKRGKNQHARKMEHMPVISFNEFI